MPKQTHKPLDFYVDSLTNSIINVVSGDSFATEVVRCTPADLKGISKRKGWRFQWNQEMNDPEKEVYKLVIASSPAVIQGFISVSYGPDHVFMNLLENAPFNIGKEKIYEGVAGNLVAFACRLSFMKGFDGFLLFESKTKLITHYKRSLGAKLLFGNRLVIESREAQILVIQYFK